MNLRKTSREALKVRVLRVPAYVWDGESFRAKYYDLIATRSLGKKPETKISLSNADETVELQKLAWMQLQRY